jgi:hypothetical protein
LWLFSGFFRVSQEREQPPEEDRQRVSELLQPRLRTGKEFPQAILVNIQIRAAIGSRPLNTHSCPITQKKGAREVIPLGNKDGVTYPKEVPRVLHGMPCRIALIVAAYRRPLNPF